MIVNRLGLAILVVAYAGVSLASNSIATLNVENGSVLVNQGKQFVTAQANQKLAVGDRIMVMEGAKADVNYADGCVQALSSGSLAVISSTSSCASGKNNVAQISPVSAQAIGDTERDCDEDGIVDSQDGDIDGDGVLNSDDNYESCKAIAAKGSNAGIWAVAGGVLIGAGVLISNGDDDTISP